MRFNMTDFQILGVWGCFVYSERVISFRFSSTGGFFTFLKQETISRYHGIEFKAVNHYAI